MKTHCWVVSYDISDGRRLRRIARIMERFGKRVQKSVFECWLTDNDRGELEKALAEVLIVPPDNVRFYPLCKDCREMALDVGNTEIMEIHTYYMV